MAYLEIKSPSRPVLQATPFKLKVSEQFPRVLLQQTFSSWVRCSPEKAYPLWPNKRKVYYAHFTVWAINQILALSALTALASRKVKPLSWEGDVEVRHGHSNIRRASVCHISLLSYKDCASHNTVQASSEQSDPLPPRSTGLSACKLESLISVLTAHKPAWCGYMCLESRCLGGRLERILGVTGCSNLPTWWV